MAVMTLATRPRSYKIVAARKPYPAGTRTQGGGVPSMARARKEAKFEVFGQEMVEKVVAKSGSSGRVYLPPDWIGKRVKVIRVD